MTHTSIPGLGRMVMPLLEISAQEGEWVVGEVLIAELFMVISKVASLSAACVLSSAPCAVAALSPEAQP